jgi:hypothetical protein
MKNQLNLIIAGATLALTSAILPAGAYEKRDSSLPLNTNIKEMTQEAGNGYVGVKVNQLKDKGDLGRGFTSQNEYSMPKPGETIMKLPIQARPIERSINSLRSSGTLMSNGDISCDTSKCASIITACAISASATAASGGAAAPAAAGCLAAAALIGCGGCVDDVLHKMAENGPMTDPEFQREQRKMLGPKGNIP